MQKVIKGVSLMILFTTIFLANGFLIVTYQNNHSKLARQKQILAELNMINSQSTTFSSGLPPMAQDAIEPEINPADARVANLQSYLRKMNSPLFEYADKIVYYSDQNNLDYRLIVAIAGQESTFCKFIPYESNNCWGWGVYGDQVIKFDNYEDRIKTVAEGLKKNYVDRGLITTEEIMKVYTPSSNSWAAAVRHFFRKIDNPI